MQRSTERILTTHTGSLGFGTFARSHFQVEPEIVWANCAPWPRARNWPRHTFGAKGTSNP